MLSSQTIYSRAATLFSTRTAKTTEKKIYKDLWLRELPSGDGYVLGRRGQLSVWKQEQHPVHKHMYWVKKKLTKEEVQFDYKVTIRPHQVSFIVYQDKYVRTAMEDLGLFMELMTLRGKAQEGLQMNIYDGPKPWYSHDQKRVLLTTARGKGDFSITGSDPKFSIPVRNRQFNKAVQLDLNRRIIKIRRQIRARAKLGAFNDLSIEKLSKLVQADLVRDLFRNPGKTYYEALCNTDSENVQSYYELLRLSEPYSYDQKRIRESHEWLDVFNKAMKRNKEAVLLHTGAVVYC